MNEIAAIGHNNPPSPFSDAVTALETVRVEAENWLDGEPIETQEQADAVGSLINDIRNARKDADTARKVEAKPFDDAKKEVQARYKPLLDSADTMLAACKELLAPFLAAQEAERKAEAERKRAEAEAAQRAATEAAMAAAETDLKAREEAEAKIAEAKRAEAKAREAETRRVGGKGRGRAVTLRTVYEAEVTDMTQLARHYWQTRKADVAEFFEEMAKRDVSNGVRGLPGVTVHEKQVAQ